MTYEKEKQEKLKTLKDLIRYSGAYTGRFVCDELRQEAIKWVKSIENAEGPDPFCCIPYAKEVFMHFFNISEEDLK